MIAPMRRSFQSNAPRFDDLGHVPCRSLPIMIRVSSRLSLAATWTLLVLTIAAALYAGSHLAQMLALEARGAIEHDAVTYMVVGRGILNGLRPYADLFETKPPGMFLLSALALLMTGDDRGALLLQVSILAAVPLLLIAYAVFAIPRDTRSLSRNVAVAIAALLGTLLALHLEERAGGFQTESFGAFFACLYLLHIALRHDASRPSAIAMNTGLLLASIETKEPFVLTILAGALLLTRDRRHFLYIFVVPLALAIVVGAALLAALGYLGPYVSLYLPAILKFRLPTDRFEPLWVRGLAVGRLFGNLTRFHPASLFGAIFAWLWFVAPVLKTQQKSLLPLVLTLALSAVAYLFMIETNVLLVLLRAMWLLPVSFDGAIAFIAIRVAAYVLLLVLLIVLLFFARKRGLAVPVLLGCGALYLTSAACGVADYLSWHWGFAFPFLFALSLLLLRYVLQVSPLSVPVMVTLMLSLATALLYQADPGHVRFLEHKIRYDSSTVTLPIARQFDELMDHCRFSSYFSEQAGVALGFAVHSPLGPLFSRRDFIGYLPPDHPLIQQTYANIRDKAQVIVLGSGATLHDILPDLGEFFTAQAPACAARFLPLDHLSLFFRKTRK